MRASTSLGIVASVSLVLACGRPPSRPISELPADVSLRDESGHDELVRDQAARAKLYVLLFFSADCPVVRAHDERIREMLKTYGPRGIAFSAVLSEVDADPKKERASLAERQLRLPLLEDRNAALADALGVEFSTHAVVLDREGHVLYSGALDSDRTHLTKDADRWLERALDAALDGRPAEKAKTEPLGCPLRKH